MASGSIYQLLQSPDDQRAKRLQVRSLLDEQAMRGMQRQQFEQGVADEREMRRLSSEAGGDLGRLSDMLGQRGLHKPAQAIRQQLTAQQKATADLAKTGAETGKITQEIAVSRLRMARDVLSMIDPDAPDAQERYGSLRGYVQTDLPMFASQLPERLTRADLVRLLSDADKSLARLIPTVTQVNDGAQVQFRDTNPNTNPGILSQSIPMQMTPAQQQSAINDPFLNQGGQAVPNVPVQQFETQRAAAGATRVNVPVSVNTERQFMGQIADAVGKDVAEASNRARSAINTIGTLTQISDALDSGNAMAGPGTTARVFLGQVGQVLGVTGTESERLSSTRQVIQGLAKLELDAAQAMRGQGSITDPERAIMRRAALGEIDNMTVGEMRTLIGVMDRSARSTIRTHRANVDQLRSNPGAAPVLPFLDTLQEPPPRASRAPGASGGSSSAPSGIDALLNKYAPQRPQ